MILAHHSLPQAPTGIGNWLGCHELQGYPHFKLCGARRTKDQSLIDIQILHIFVKT